MKLILKYLNAGKLPVRGRIDTNYYGDKTYYIPVFKDDSGDVNVSLPDIEITPRNNLSLEGAVDKGRRKAAPYVGAIVGGATVPAFAPFASAIMANPYVNAVLTVDGVRNALSGDGVLKTYRLVKKGDYWGATKSGVGDVLDLYGGFNLVNKTNKALQNVGKRTIETIMRTSPKANPVPIIKENFNSMINGKYGGKSRLFHIGNYILTGKKIGPKGYYNSFAPFSQYNSSTFIKNPKIKDRIEAFFNPKGDIFAYNGYLTLYGTPTKHTEENDIIDAFLYSTDIDPIFGVKKVGKDYGIHRDYVNNNYPNKDIPVYEVLNPNSILEQDIIPLNWEGDNKFSTLFGSNMDNILNAAGHLKLNGLYNGRKVVRRLDIWKFNPKDYKNKWLDETYDYNHMPAYQKRLVNAGLKYIDKIGTPVITKTKWMYEE